MNTERVPALEAVLFDMDGVLVDSFEVWLAVLRETAERLGFPPVDRARLESMFGQGIDEDERTLFPGAGTDAVRAAYDESFPRHLDRLRVNAEAASTLQALRARQLSTAIVTNTQPSLTETIVRDCGLAEYVDVLSPAVPERREKPAPDLVVYVLDELDVPEERAVLVGDSEYDEKAARAAGVAFVHYEMRSGESLRAAVERVIPPAGASGHRW